VVAQRSALTRTPWSFRCGRKEVGHERRIRERVRAAVVAGWWVVLIAVAFLTLLWFVYLAVMSAQPVWLLTLWGPGVDWPFVQNVWFWAMAAFKFCVWLMVFAVLWLTLWARQLRKLDRQGTH
jgi:hypothetical protein